MGEVRIIGCGPGARDWLTDAARHAVAGCDLLVGHTRLLGLFDAFAGETFALEGNYTDALALIHERSAVETVGVLVSGDPGVHSLAKLVAQRVGRELCVIIPGISSVQYAFAKVGVTWSDAAVASVHAAFDGEQIQMLARSPKVCILTDGPGGPARIARTIEPESVASKRIFVCENLSLPEERVTELTLDELRCFEAGRLNVVLLIDSSLL